MTNDKPIYTSTFVFAKGEFDETFYKLDAEIAEIAKSIPGYLGEESWENAATGLVSNVYYWDSIESLQQLVSHPKHLEAKARQSDWLNGYQVVISQVIRVYGDAKLSGLKSIFTLTQHAKGTGQGREGLL